VILPGASHVAGYHIAASLCDGAPPEIGHAAGVVACLCFGAALLVGTRLRPLRVALIVGCFLLAGLGRGAYTERKSRDVTTELSSFEGEDVTVVGIVSGFPSIIEGGLRFTLEVCSARSADRSRRWERSRPRLLVTLRPSAEVHYGDLLSLTGKLAIPTGPRNPGGFDYKGYLSSKGLCGVFRAKKHAARLLDEGYGISLFSRVLGPTRRGIGGMLGDHLEGEPHALMRGLLLGDRSLLDPELRDAMAQAGVVHIMAVSGLHVGLVALILGWGARCALLSAREAEVLSLVGVWLFCAIVGFPASACRAASMVSAYLVCRRLERPATAFGSLGAAAFVMAVVHPGWASTPGFQLSFSAAAGVLTFKDTIVTCIERLGREPGPILKSAATLAGASLGAQITSWPLVALHFGRTPLLFLVGNAVAVPLVGVLLTWGLTALALNVVSAVAAGWVLASCWAAASALIEFCTHVGSIPWASVSIPAFGAAYVAIYFIALAAAASSRGRRRLCAGGALAVCSLAICLGVPRPSRGGELEAAFLDVGHGDACVVLAPTGETMLVDAGASLMGWDAGERIIVPYLRQRGVREIDRAVISHGDGDHWGGLECLADHVPVKELVLPRAVPLGPLADLVPELEAEGTSVRWVEAGDTLPPMGGLECVVVHPSPRFEELRGRELGEDLNDRSLVLRVTFGGIVFLMTGDIEAAAEEWLVGGRPAALCALLDCTVLKVPHHGSNTSSSAALISAASPLAAVISCGPKERFNLPRPEVLERLRAHGVSTMMTVRDGAVLVRTDGERVTVTPYLRPSESFVLYPADG